MRRLLLITVLAAAFLGVLATPAFAVYPVDYEPNVAYVHPWGDPAYWEEVLWEYVPLDGQMEWVWHVWDTDQVSNGWGEGYKEIPPSYDVMLVAAMMGIPRGQIEAMPGDLRLEFSLADQATPGDTMVAMTAKEAKRYWGRAIGPDGWAMPTINKDMAQMWIIGWTYDLGQLDPGTYGGPAAYIFQHSMIDITVWSDPWPDPWPRTPTHYFWKGTYPCPYTFTVASE